MTVILGLVMRLISPILGMQAAIGMAVKGDVVQSDWIGHLRVFGRRVRAGVVFELED
jgi:hypothetical protein